MEPPFFVTREVHGLVYTNPIPSFYQSYTKAILLPYFVHSSCIARACFLYVNKYEVCMK